MTGAALRTLKGHRWVQSIAFSPDGRQVVSGAADNEPVRLWDAVTGAVLQTLKGHSKSVYSVAFSPDGRQVISGSSDNTVRLWDTATGAALQTLEGHSDANSVAFSLDGNISRALFASTYWTNWVTEGESNLVRLPPVYQATCQAIWNETIVLGHSSGKISILGFKEGSKLI
jgi:WD40 repeat protein